jgi:hypothetical protein
VRNWDYVIIQTKVVIPAPPHPKTAASICLSASCEIAPLPFGGETCGVVVFAIVEKQLPLLNQNAIINGKRARRGRAFSFGRMEGGKVFGWGRGAMDLCFRVGDVNLQPLIQTS